MNYFRYPQENAPERSRRPDFKIYILVLVVLVLAMFSYIYISSVRPPKAFPVGSIITIESGSSLYTLAEKLRKDGVIRSPFWFRAAAITLGGEHGMQAGEYFLPEPENIFSLASRLVRGDYKLKRHRITVPEGFTSRKISALFDNERFPLFDNTFFELEAREGYLFPDTYFLQESATASSTLKVFKNNFDKKIATLASEIELSKRTLSEIITMASILEGEAKTPEDMAIVSDILWRRLDMGMALQVDTSFVYLLGKSTSELTVDDLKIDSPYNTYINRGLPPTPVSNPGLESIRAALHPTTTPYLYFLTANDGTMHYSKTFDEHVTKKQRYLNN